LEPSIIGARIGVFEDKATVAGGLSLFIVILAIIVLVKAI